MYYILYIYIYIYEAWVVQWILTTGPPRPPLVRPLADRVKGPGFDSSIAQHDQRLISWTFTCGWFTCIELVLGPTTWVHFLPVPLDSIV